MRFILLATRRFEAARLVKQMNFSCEYQLYNIKQALSIRKFLTDGQMDKTYGAVRVE